eukprot:6057479-Pyramimonas_sp.AAC.1
MGACCRMGVPARTGAFPGVRRPAPIPIASPSPSDLPTGMGVCRWFIMSGVWGVAFAAFAGRAPLDKLRHG